MLFYSQVPAFARELSKLNPSEVDRMQDLETAFMQLLSILPKFTKKSVFILIDSIDEADPLEWGRFNQQGGLGQPCGNRTMYMLG